MAEGDNVELCLSVPTTGHVRPWLGWHATFFFTGLKNVRGYHEGFNQDYKGYPKTKPDNISGSTYLHEGSENIKLKEWSPRGKGTSG